MSRFSLSWLWWPCWPPFSSAPSPRSKHRGRSPRARFGTPARRRAGCARPAATKRPCGLRSGLALLLLCGAGLMLRSFLYLNRVSPGFLTEHLLTMKIALPGGTYPRPEQTRAYLDRVMERLQTLPGVASVAAASTLPLSGDSDWGTFLIDAGAGRSEEHTSELQSPVHRVCRLLLEKKNV